MFDYGATPWPDWFDGFRPGQEQAVAEIVEAFQDGFKVVFLEAPTGSGKTLIGDAVRRAYAPEKSVYCVTTKTLQKQIAQDFPYADVLMGRSNYPTLNGGSWVDCGDCTQGMDVYGCVAGCDPDEVQKETHCHYCHPMMDCPYRKAREAASESELPVLNLQYFLTATNKAGNWVDRELVIIDEADALEEELMRFIDLTITPRQQREMNLGLPKKKTKPESWLEWAFEAERAIYRTIKMLEDRLYDRDGKLDLKVVRKRKRYQEMYDRVIQLQKPLPSLDGVRLREIEGGWVYDENMRKEGAFATFKSILLDRQAPDVLWKHGKKFLLMSATIISASRMAGDMGIPDNDWTYVRMDSSFDWRRRMVFVNTAGNMAMKEKETEWPKTAKRVAELIREHPGVRILVHTVSYALTKVIEDAIAEYAPKDRRRVFTYYSAKDRNEALDRYLERHDGVLLASSFERGVDLHEDACRLIIIPKVPFPYLGDKQIAARLYGHGRAGREWYEMTTVRTICQMTGRGMRSANDFCEAYILDRQFTRIWKDSRYLFPKWWAEAVVFDPNDPKVRRARAEVAEDRV